MKKNIFFIAFSLLLIILLSGCDCLGISAIKTSIQTKYDKMMDLCGAEGVTFVEETMINKGKTIYRYETFFDEVLKEDKKKKKEYVFFTTAVLGDNVYIAEQFASNYPNSDYCFGILNHKTLEFKKIGYYCGSVGVRVFGNYVIFMYNDTWTFYNINGEIVETSINGDYQIGDNCYYVKNPESRNITIYDYDLNKYQLNIDSFYSAKLLANNHLYFYDTEHKYHCCDVRNNTIYDAETAKVLEEIDNPKQKYIYGSKDKCTDSDNNVVVTLDELRELNDVIDKLEENFNTTVEIETTIRIDGTWYILVGNNDSFFGLHSGKETYALVYEISDAYEVSYLGCVGAIYPDLLCIYKD